MGFLATATTREIRLLCLSILPVTPIQSCPQERGHPRIIFTTMLTLVALVMITVDSSAPAFPSSAVPRFMGPLSSTSWQTVVGSGQGFVNRKFLHLLDYTYLVSTTTISASKQTLVLLSRLSLPQELVLSLHVRQLSLEKKVRGRCSTSRTQSNVLAKLTNAPEDFHITAGLLAGPLISAIQEMEPETHRPAI